MSKESDFGSGFDCPTIGVQVPEDSILIQDDNGKWVVKSKKINNKNIN